MHAAPMIYFNGEKNAGLFLAVLGLAAIAAATVLYRSGPDLRSFALTLTVFALAEIALGVLINAAGLLAFDIIAERRGAIYRSAIDQHRV